MKIKILGHEYTVEYPETFIQRNGDAVADIVYRLLSIRIDPTAEQSRQDEALLHEILHAIDFHLELELSHKQISGISESLLQILLDNDLLRKKLGLMKDFKIK
jgi:hypothetical protein